MGRDDVFAILRDFKQNFAEKYGILEIGILGSITWNEAREDSDIDICIKTKTPDPFYAGAYQGRD